MQEDHKPLGAKSSGSNGGGRITRVLAATWLLAAYNSLTDKHLAGYFNNTRIRRHLLRSGLITRSGRIVSEKEYKLNSMKRDHQKYIRECLAQAIFHKVLDMERYHQLEIKKKLEAAARKERVQRFKGDPTGWSVENNMPILSPHPPFGQKSNWGHSVPVDEGHSSPSTMTTPRPYTAPGHPHPPVRLEPLPSDLSAGPVPKKTSRLRGRATLREKDAPFPIGGQEALMKFRSSMDSSQGTHLYQLPNIHNYMMPIPPPPPPPDGKFTKENRTETWRKRRFRPITAPNGLEPLFTRDSRRIHKTSLHSNAVITMVYLGRSVHLAYDGADFRDDVKVYQQHCGGENLCVYKGKLLEKETFQFVSKRHHGFPFSLTFFLNGIQVNRLSSCCEHKHRKGSRLGGKRGYFGFVCVERSSPCYKCIIAMGLDKKPSSSKIRKETAEKREELKKDGEKLRKVKEYMTPRGNEIEGTRALASAIVSAQEEPQAREVRTAVEEMESKGKLGQDTWGDDQENAFKYEYEEDFEADEEKQDENTNEEGQADDQVNGMSKSPPDDEKAQLDPEKESGTSSEKAPDADDSVKDGSDGRSDDEVEDDKQDRKTASSSSPRSRTDSSCSEDESSVEDRDSPTEISSELSASSSPSREQGEDDTPGKSRLPTDTLLEIELEDQDITKAVAEAKPGPAEKSPKSVLEEEMEKGAQGTAEGPSMTSSERVFQEEKETAKRKLWRGSPAKEKDEKAGAPRVDKEGDGPITVGSLEPGRHSTPGAEPWTGSTDEREKHVRKLEVDIHPAPNGTSMVEGRLDSDTESKRVAPDMHKLETKATIEHVPQPKDADTIEGKGEMTLVGDIELKGVPCGEWKVAAVQPVLTEESLTVESEAPRELVDQTRAAAGGDGSLGEEELKLTETEGARAFAWPNEDGALEEQGSIQSKLETGKAVSEGDEDSGKPGLGSRAVAPHSEWAGGLAMPLEKPLVKGAGQRGAGTREAGSGKPGDTESEEEAGTHFEKTAPVQAAMSKREDGSEDGGELLKGSKEDVRVEASLSSFISGETDELTQMGGQGSPEEERSRLKKGVGKETMETETADHRENDSRDLLPEELETAGERTEDPRPRTPRREGPSKGEDGERVSASEEGPALQEEEGVQRNEPHSAGDAEPVVQGLSQGADQADSGAVTLARAQPEELFPAGGMAMPEAAAGLEKSLGSTWAPGKQGDRDGDQEQEGSEAEDGGGAELPQQEAAGPQGDSQGGLGVPVPESQLSGKAGTAPQVTIVTSGEAEESKVQGQDGLPDLEGREKEECLPGHEGVKDVTGAPGDGPAGDTVMAEKFHGGAPGEAMDKAQREHLVGQDVLSSRSTVSSGNLGKGTAGAQADSSRGDTAEMATSQGDMAEMATSQGDMAEMATSQGDTAEMATSQGDKAEMATSQGDTAEMATSQGDKAEMATSQGDMVEMAIEEPEGLADSKRAVEGTATNTASSWSEVAGEETRQEMEGREGQTSAVERLVVAEIAQSREEGPAVQEVTVTLTPGVGPRTLGEASNVEKEPPPRQGRGPEGRKEGSTAGAGSLQGEEGAERSQGRQESGAAQATGPGWPQQGESEPTSEGTQAAELPPGNPDFPDTQETPEPLLQRENEDADALQHHVEAQATAGQMALAVSLEMPRDSETQQPQNTASKTGRQGRGSVVGCQSLEPQAEPLQARAEARGVCVFRAEDQRASLPEVT
ncbi:glutamate-rich protein 3 [Tenrec ecaudatus]|uniref:glutamate-rich protein 3 n=1 Tax=Tenrec ecaudatus TaxID=94439 RepID=UPI003F5A7005